MLQRRYLALILHLNNLRWGLFFIPSVDYCHHRLRQTQERLTDHGVYLRGCRRTFIAVFTNALNDWYLCK